MAMSMSSGKHISGLHFSHIDERRDKKGEFAEKTIKKT